MKTKNIDLFSQHYNVAVLVDWLIGDLINFLL